MPRSDTLIVHILSSLDKSGVEIMRTAFGAIEGTQGKIAGALMERSNELRCFDPTNECIRSVALNGAKLEQ